MSIVVDVIGGERRLVRLSESLRVRLGKLGVTSLVKSFKIELATARRL